MGTPISSHGAEVLRSPYTKKEREELFLRCPVCDGTVSEETPIFVVILMKPTYHRPQVIQILKELHVLASFVGGVFPLPPFS